MFYITCIHMSIGKYHARDSQARNPEMTSLIRSSCFKINIPICSIVNNLSGRKKYILKKSWLYLLNFFQKSKIKSDQLAILLSVYVVFHTAMSHYL